MSDKRMDLLEARVAALEAAAKPPADTTAAVWKDRCEEAEKYGIEQNERASKSERHNTAMSEAVVRLRQLLVAAERERDEQKERAEGLEKELGTVRERLRTADEERERIQNERDDWRRRAEDSAHIANAYLRDYRAAARARDAAVQVTPAELVAIRDAAVEFYRGSTATPMRFAAAMERLFELTRQEAEKGANDVRSR